VNNNLRPNCSWCACWRTALPPSGSSQFGVQPEDVSIDSEIADLEALRTYFRLDSMAVLGHSWGGLLAMEYAIHFKPGVRCAFAALPGRIGAIFEC
jgi:pimeloyl-ACP methyl ester carboxylesterase